MTPDTEGLHPIANADKADRVADIVFVHGAGRQFAQDLASWEHWLG